MFQNIATAPADSIFGLMEQFRDDPRPGKINLTAGVYQNETGQTPILNCIKRAEQQLLASETSKSYLGIAGMLQFNENIKSLILGTHSNAVAEQRAVTIQTPGGTGALRVVADLLRSLWPSSRIWLSDPTWPNHEAIFEGDDIPIARYRYLKKCGTELDFDSMVDALRSAKPGDAVLLHACCHNPTGVDPDPDQWSQLAEVIADCRALPVFDFAYQGFGQSLEQDAIAVRMFAEHCGEVLICSSYSKNFGLYSERVGGLTAVCADPQSAAAMYSQIKSCARIMYSNPPRHGASLVNMILNDPKLHSDWEVELQQMRGRIHSLRHQLADTLNQVLPGRDFSFITRQCGMFSYIGLTPHQADRLIDDYSIYLLRCGRINVAGLNSENMARFCDAVADVSAAAVK